MVAAAALALAGSVLAAADPSAAADMAAVPPGGGPHVRVFQPDGREAGGFFAYEPAFEGGVRVAVGNLDRQRSGLELVTAAGPGGGPHVRIFDRAGTELGGFFAFDRSFTGGVHLAVGDVDGDGTVETVAAAGPGGGPHVRVFDNWGREEAGFFAYDPAFRGGVRVAVADVDGDDRDEIVTVPGPTGGPHVRVFDAGGREEGGFFAYDAGFTGGLFVAAGNVRGDANAEIVTAPGPTGSPRVKTFSASGVERASFLAYDDAFRGGVSVAVGEVTGDGPGEIVTGPGRGGGPHVRAFTSTGRELAGFFAYDPGFGGGVNVAAGGGQIVVGAGVAQAFPRLAPGDRGHFVEELQRHLRALRYWIGPVDGIYGTLTEQAVFAFQKVNGLAVDGTFDQPDWARLETAGPPSPRTTRGDVVEVDKAAQVFHLVRDGRLLWTFHTSTGTEDPYTYDGRQYLADTPNGHWSVFRQEDGWSCGRLGCLWRPKYFHEDGIAVHGFDEVPPEPASHGCVRVTIEAMDFIWQHDLIPIGMDVWVHGTSPT